MGLGPTLTQVAKDFKKGDRHQCQPGEHRPGRQDLGRVLSGRQEDSHPWRQLLPFSTEGETVTINLTGDPKVKARGIFGDYLGKSYTGNQKLSDGVAALGTGSEGLREGSGLHRQVTFAVKQSGVVMTGIR